MRHLVFHQRDKRGDDDANTFFANGRHLESHRLAASSRHQPEGIATFADAFDDVKLDSPEAVVAPVTFENVMKLAVHSSLGRISSICSCTSLCLKMLSSMV